MKFEFNWPEVVSEKTMFQHIDGTLRLKGQKSTLTF